MGEFTASIVWNRGTTRDLGDVMKKGDVALAGMLRAHGLIMNGGVLNAAEILTENDFDDAVAGYQFFGLASIADQLEQAKTLLAKAADVGSYESSFDSEYRRVVPDDSSLFAAFERHFVANPRDYATV